MANRVFYNGDVNPEYGGLFYTLETVKLGYVDIVRITPCSDAGGPDNCFWIDVLNVNIERCQDDIDKATSDCGWTDEYRSSSKAQKTHMTIVACVAAGFYDCDDCDRTMVRIGKPDEYYNGVGEFNPDCVFRAGTRIGNLARRALRAGFVW